MRADLLSGRVGRRLGSAGGHVFARSRSPAGFGTSTVSSALGRDAAAYRIVGASGGLTGANAGQGLRLRFDGRGVSLVSPAGALGLELVALGGGGSLGPVPRVAPTASANRVVYRRPGLEEWYANGPLGLEQGFTLTHRPAGRGAVTLALRLSGSLARSARLEGGTLRLGSLVYRDLVASDAAGRRLPARLELAAGRRLLIRVDVRRARYPLTIDPLIQQGSKLTGSGATSSANFGYSVAVSGDGKTALIGGSSDNGNAGAAWVFTRSGTTWTQQTTTKLTPSDESGNAQFGITVALSSDGNTALIGGNADNSYVGAAWVFTRSGTTWTQQTTTKLTATDESGNAFFGNSVALSSDGNTALIGGDADNSHCRGGLGVHALGNDVDTANDDEAHRD